MSLLDEFRVGFGIGPDTLEFIVGQTSVGV